MKLEFRTAHLDDLEYLAPRLREEDRREVETATGRPVLDVLDSSWALSDENYVAFLPGALKPFAVFGVVNPGVIWMLSTPDIRKCGMAATRLAQRFISSWLNEYCYLYNIVDSRNTMHVRWLKALGAHFEAAPRVINGTEFLVFSISKEAQRVRTNNDYDGHCAGT